MEILEKEIEIEEQIKEMKKYKDFQVDYIRLFIEEYDKSKGKMVNKPVNIESYLSNIKEYDVKDRNKKYKSDIIRLQEITKLENLEGELADCKNIWALHFVRIKFNQISPIATNDGEFSETLLDNKLEADQHLAETTACLYDASKEMLIIARNRDGVMPSAIIEFIRSTSKNRKLTYGIIPNDKKIKSKEAKIYRKVLIGINDLDKLNDLDKRKLFNIRSVGKSLKAFDGYGYCNIKIELSMGKAPKNESMNNEEINLTTLELMELGLDNINKIELSSKEDKGSKIETIDLINNRIKDKFTLSYTRKNPITFEKQKK